MTAMPMHEMPDGKVPVNSGCSISAMTICRSDTPLSLQAVLRGSAHSKVAQDGDLGALFPLRREDHGDLSKVPTELPVSDDFKESTSPESVLGATYGRPKYE